MKTREQIIEWIKGQDWFEEFCVKAGFHVEDELEEYVDRWMSWPYNVIRAAFEWSNSDIIFWHQCEGEYLKWLESKGEQNVPNKPESVSDEAKFVFEGGKREAPFYIVFMDDVRLGAVQCFFPAFERAMGKAHEMAKIKNCKAYVLAAVGEIQPEVVTKAVSINDMEIRDSNLNF